MYCRNRKSTPYTPCTAFSKFAKSSSTPRLVTGSAIAADARLSLPATGSLVLIIETKPTRIQYCLYSSKLQYLSSGTPNQLYFIQHSYFLNTESLVLSCAILLYKFLDPTPCSTESIAKIPLVNCNARPPDAIRSDLGQSLSINVTLRAATSLRSIPLGGLEGLWYKSSSITTYVDL